MEENYVYPSPFQNFISFHKVIENLEEIANSDVDYRAKYAQALLQEIEPFPEFRNGIEDFDLIFDYCLDIIHHGL